MQDHKQSEVAAAERTESKVLLNGDNYGGSLVLANASAAKNLPALGGKTALANDNSFALAKKKLEQIERHSARTYEGWRGWWRLIVVTSVIGRLALYLYLDRYDIA